jgi:hypothetical protein
MNHFNRMLTEDESFIKHLKEHKSGSSIMSLYTEAMKKCIFG